MGVSFAIEAPRALDWQFSSACDDPLLLGLYEAAKREFTGQGPLREVCETAVCFSHLCINAIIYQDRLRTNIGKTQKQTVFLQVILYQRTDNRTTAELTQIADFAIRNRRSFTAVSPTTYQVTAQGELKPWSDHDEAFAAQFIAHGLRVLPLIWADCAAHPRPIAAFRKIMAQPASFIAAAVERAQKHQFGGFVLDWEPTGSLTLEDMAAFPRFIDTFAAAMHAASPPLELHVFAGWVREQFQPIDCYVRAGRELQCAISRCNEQESSSSLAG